MEPRTAPPRSRLEEAAIDLAADQTDLLAAFRVFSDLCRTRRTDALTIAAHVRARKRLRHRGQLLALLDDLAQGACSVLEREYLVRVERAHGLPPGRRQSRDDASGRPVFRDVDYEDFRVLVELDGREFHDNPGPETVTSAETWTQPSPGPADRPPGLRAGASRRL